MSKLVDVSKGLFPEWLRQSIGPLFLMASTPLTVLLMVHTQLNLDGSFLNLWGELKQDPMGTISKSWVTPSAKAWQYLLIFAAFEAVIMRLVPGKTFKGPVTAKTGHQPIYKANGFQCYLLTLAVFVIAGFGFKLFDPASVYDMYQEMVCAVMQAGLALVVLLYIKGSIPALRSPGDHGSSGNIFMDLYWGRELYPRIAGWDIKMFTNCRFGMMAWALLPIAFAAKSMQLHPEATGIAGLSNAFIVNLIVQLVYVSKFFWWETGYLATMDIQHDRAGFYICWGCLVWVPSLYVSHSLYLVNHGLNLSREVALLYLVIGLAAVYINYEADNQRKMARATDGNCSMWGKPCEVVNARYYVHNEQTGEKEEKSTILLKSGWWGVARHFHYVPELTATLMWSIPGGFDHFMPYAYFAFLTALLLDRAYRDDDRCSKKYGSYWEEYRKAVPYKILPFLL